MEYLPLQQLNTDILFLNKLFGKPDNNIVNKLDVSSESTLFYLLNLYKSSTTFSGHT